MKKVANKSLFVCCAMQVVCGVHAQDAAEGQQKKGWATGFFSRFKDDSVKKNPKKSSLSAVVERRAHKKPISTNRKREMIEHLAQDLEQVQIQADQKIDFLQQELDKQKEFVEQARKKVTEKDGMIADLIAAKDQLHKEREKSDLEIVSLKNQVQEAQQKLVALEFNRTQYEQYTQELHAQNGRLEQQLASLNREYTDKKEQQERERSMQELTQLKEEMLALKKELKAHETKQFSHEKPA